MRSNQYLLWQEAALIISLFPNEASFERSLISVVGIQAHKRKDPLFNVHFTSVSSFVIHGHFNQMQSLSARHHGMSR